MFELTLLTVLGVIVVLAVRRGKPVILDKPLIINRVGKFHATLAPQLNLAQGLIEQVHAQLVANGQVAGESDVLCYQVQDANVCRSAPGFYLLAVSLRQGVLYFQAILPQPLIRDADSHAATVQAFAQQVMCELPPPVDVQARSAITQAVARAAQHLSIFIQAL